MELTQALSSLICSIRMEMGCLRCDFCRSIEDENRFLLLEEWDTKENLMTHLNSECYKVLSGAMTLLKEPCESMFYTVLHPEMIEEV